MRTLALAFAGTATATSSFIAACRSARSGEENCREREPQLPPVDGSSGRALAVRVDDLVLFFDGGFADLGW